MRVGWLGLGAMGAPMAACLARAGHEVTGYDVAPERAIALAGAGVRAAGTIAAAAGTADVIVIMVATPDQLEQALFGPVGADGTSPRNVVHGFRLTAPADVDEQFIAWLAEAYQVGA